MKGSAEKKGAAVTVVPGEGRHPTLTGEPGSQRKKVGEEETKKEVR